MTFFDPRHNGDSPPHVFQPPSPAALRERADAAARAVLRIAAAQADRALLAGADLPALRIVAAHAPGGRERAVAVPASTALRAASRAAGRALAAAEAAALDPELLAALREVAHAG